ncbi:helix-turn-helix transcriptional regulator [Azospirillum griseum]|uniref:AraC family transcriptional regulator n=1 Tax=Azospirillum griseum TaxID=2496639 RepID=A0A431VB09_9PROT|nr:AraC family transcriptional regulator [Azospirillum griseum]RTR15091.1 AraC family transcriptional regulator [Azospirillum griseum]
MTPKRPDTALHNRLTAWRPNGAWKGVELCHAFYRDHHFPLHAHPDVHIALIESGRYRFRCDGRPQQARAGDLVILPPDTLHDGGAMDAAGYAYRQILIPLALWTGAAGQMGIPGRSPVRRNPEIARSLRAVFTAWDHRDPFQFDATLARLIGQIVTTGGTEANDGALTRVTPRLLARVLDMMRQDLAEPWTLASLAAAVGTSRFVLSRRFRQHYGLGLHDWLMDARLRQARHWLAVGMPAAEVAVACGFTDQSHLARRFKKGFGITPGQFTTFCTSVQS